MRPVNLIPPEERRGDRAPTRTGPIAYILVGALALAVAGVTAVVLTNNSIADSREEKSALEVRQAEAEKQVAALAPYAEFASLQQTRASTVDSLARSRFDWERVLQELALVLPEEVQLSSVTGTVAPGVSVGEGSSSALRDGAPGPALEILGCAANNEVVAELAAALEDIDGVTRVGVNSSTSTAEDAASTATAGGTSAEGCDTDQPVFQFEMLAAFDEVTVPGTETVPAEPGAAPTTAPPAEGDGGLAEVQGQQQEASDSAAEQTDKAESAANLVPGVAR